MGDLSKVLVGVATITIGEGPGLTVGYTVDGVTMSIRSDFSDIKVEENVGTIKRILSDQELRVTFNMAEGTLENMAAAIPGASLADPILTLGGGDLQETKLTLVGTNPAGFNRTIVLTAVNPVGEVGIPYKKGEISVVPVTFAALVADTGIFGTVTDAAA